ncbi:hypothetical protein PLEOSDRAFT_1109079 [Pleurotus ostreatus PC15]|uniref:DUF676 domain-containing protein n=1 Tax=Pleurotus ostreatus (strain PC15) TaxID=1137138 RepID=A0A067N5Z1_PLEO1|nr:hypothetical protein PLEOSDRAFT_1109079 [Pleurotus ostreatus PC15]
MLHYDTQQQSSLSYGERKYKDERKAIGNGRSPRILQVETAPVARAVWFVQIDEHRHAIVSFRNHRNLRRALAPKRSEESLGDRRFNIDDKFNDGFTVLSEGSQVDIVALHGLNGHSFESWECKDTRFMWLRDHLPEQAPNARVMVYGYKAEGFLLAHSMGSLVIKKALLLARDLEADGQYKAILNSVRGVVFIGTPHRGRNGVDGAKFVAIFVRAFNVDVRYDLISSLRPASTDLFDLGSSFGRLLTDRNHIKIATLYETKTTRIGWPVVGNWVWIVDEQSAILAVAGKRRLSINTNHTDLIKFSHAADTSLSSTVQIVEEFCSNQSFGMTSSTTTLYGPIPAAQGLHNPANVSLISSEDSVVHIGSPSLEGSLIQDTPLRRQSTRTPSSPIQLMPPSGTSFWSVEDIPLFSGSRIYDKDKAYWMTSD